MIKQAATEENTESRSHVAMDQAVQKVVDELLLISWVFETFVVVRATYGGS